jgi:hypothetical protein
MLSLSDQVRDDPVVLPDLEILGREGDQFGAPQATSNQDCENRPVTLAPETLGRLFLQQTSRLLDRQPVADPDA